MHYVIVTDLTEENNSAQIRQSLADLVMNLVPLENTQISLICYGYKDANGDAFPFSGNVETAEGKYVHEITLPEEYSDADAAEYRNALVQTLSGLSAKSGRRSPHGHALLASMQHMEKAGTRDGNGRVILISDGNRASDAPSIDNGCKVEALRISQAHHWPIYTIELDQDNIHLSLSEDSDYNALNSGSATHDEFPRIWMTEVAWKSGATRIDPDNSNALLPGTWVIGGTPDAADAPLETVHMTQAHSTALEILGFQPKTNTFDSDGIMDIPFTVSNLTCEYLFYLQNTAPDDISVFPVSDSNELLTDKPVEENILRKTAGNSYSTIRLLCPTPGKYVLRVKGQANAKILTGSRSVIAPELKITFPSKSGNPLACDNNETLLLPYGDPLSVVVECWYGETLLLLSPDDKTYTAQLTLELDKQNNTNDSYDTILEKTLTPGETNWSFMGCYLSDDDIHPDNNSHSYRVCISLIPNGSDAAPEFTKEYSLNTVTDAPDPSNESEVIELGDIPPLGTAEFSLEEMLDDMPAGSLKFSLVGLDNAGNAFHLLSPDDQEAHTELIGDYRLLTLQTNNCVGKYEATLSVSCFDHNKPFILRFNITEPEGPNIEDFDIVLYDREPLKLFKPFIKNYEVSHPHSWDDGLLLQNITECNPQIVRFSENGDGNVTFTARSVGEADITATLTNGICRMDENHMIQYYTDDCTIHVTVKSMAQREMRFCILFAVSGLVIALIIYIPAKICKVPFSIIIHSNPADEDQPHTLQGKKPIGSFVKKEEICQEVSEDNRKPNSDDLNALNEFLQKTHLSPLLVRFFPILVTGIPDRSKVSIGNKTCKFKFALITKKHPLQYDQFLTIQKKASQ